MQHPVAEYVNALLGSRRLGHQVVIHRPLPAVEAVYAPTVRPWPLAVQNLLAASGAQALYAHQALATDMVRAGRHVVVATPTASGKTTVYNLPVIERVLHDPDARALYLFPLKALAQDQLKAFAALTESWPRDARPRAAIYDGDTTPWFRKKIRDNPPHVLMTNPEMLHLSLLPHHEQWAAFLAGLSFVVVDEVHTYRGVLGSHMAQLFRRLHRVCRRFGAAPTFVFCSATIGNPGELAGQLAGLDVAVVDKSGAPQGTRHFVFIDPLEGTAQTAILLLQSALHRGLRTIVYTQSRKMTELVSLWASQRSGPYRDRISAYRAGFLPEERREIEARMASGDLLAVISTSALELGIDIGGLDLCILVGYPGTVMQTLQRGGRVGRAMQESAVVLVAGEDALDQYFMRNPNDFFERPPECAVCNPANPVILGRHLECAAAELPLDVDEPWLAEPAVAARARELEACATLLRSKDGTRLFSARKAPQRHVDLRGSGRAYQIEAVDSTGDTGRVVGSVDEHRAFKETHPGAVYLHRGDSYVVRDLDLATRTVRARKEKVDYYTRARGNKSTDILETLASRAVWGTCMHFGRLRVTDTVTGYEKRRIRANKLMTVVPLDLPPLVFETEGIWFEIPMDAQRRAEAGYMHFMGGIHALEHAAIGILPLLVMSDRNDFGGISTPMHPQVALPCVFIYDAAPGGVGLAAEAFERAEELFERTLTAIRSCPCERGCPSCVHSPKCGSGNRPIDKAAAAFLLETVRGLVPPADCHAHRILPAAPPLAESAPPATPLEEDGMPQSVMDTTGPRPGNGHALPHYGVVDVETQRSAAEVGGWHKAHKMRVSVAVLYDSATDAFTAYREEEIPALLARLRDFDLVVGFNIKRFDYTVLGAYTRDNLHDLPTLDMLEEVRKALNYRLSLDHLAKATLGSQKSADGLQALAWWKEGRIEEIAAYCEADVRITRDLYLYGRDNGYVLYTNKAGSTVRCPVRW
ncbi:MAG: DEAD/DEAH box helicase [Desulfovibrionaceae bacterium]